MSAVLPVIAEGQRTFRPGIFATFAVAALLGAFAFITLGSSGIFYPYITPGFFRYGNTAIALVFALRALGDFRYIGFFKKATGTLFAHNETRYYPPLCVVIATISLMLSWPH